MCLCIHIVCAYIYIFCPRIDCLTICQCNNHFKKGDLNKLKCRQSSSAEKCLVRVRIIDIFSLHTLGCFQLSNYYARDLQDGTRVRRGDHLPPHKYIRNTSTCGTTPTEHLLNAGRRPQTFQKARNSPRTWVGQKKKQRQKNREETCTTGREL